MYTETSTDVLEGDIGRLIFGPYVGASSGNCFRFWYHAYGDTIGKYCVHIYFLS